MKHEYFIWIWLTYGWLIEHMGSIILILIISIIILLAFPILLGYDLKKEIDNKKDETE